MSRNSLSILVHKIRLEHVLLLLILVTSIFLRFYNTPARYGFDNDPTRDILLVRYAAENKIFPLVGALSGIAPFTFGPWYYYHLIAAYLVFPFQYSPWILVGVTSVLAVFFMYETGKLLQGRWFGVLLAFLMAITPSETGQTQGLSNPNLVPLYSALTIWLFVKLIKKPSSGWLLVWGVVLGIGINIHYQMVCLLVLPLIYLIYYRNAFIKNFFIFTSGFAVTFIPLIIFNLQYHWHTVTSFVFYVTQGRTATYIPNSWKLYVEKFWFSYFSYIFGLPVFAAIVLGVFTAAVFVWQVVKRKLNVIYIMLIIAFIFDFFFLRYFISRRDYYYYLFLHPFIFIFTGFAIYQISKIKYGIFVSLFILGIFVITMGKGDVQRLSSRQDFMNIRTQAMALSDSYQNQQVSFYVCSDHGRDMAQGLIFFLSSSNLVAQGEQGKKIGVGDFECKLDYQDKALVSASREKLDMGEKLVDLSSESPQSLKNDGWILLTPQTVYRDTVDWWKNR